MINVIADLSGVLHLVFMICAPVFSNKPPSVCVISVEWLHFYSEYTPDFVKEYRRKGISRKIYSSFDAFVYRK